MGELAGLRSSLPSTLVKRKSGSTFGLAEVGAWLSFWLDSSATCGSRRKQELEAQPSLPGKKRSKALHLQQKELEVKAQQTRRLHKSSQRSALRKKTRGKSWWKG